MTQTLEALTEDGVTLSLRRFRHQGPARGCALLSHAMMANARSVAPLARGLCAHGIDCYTLDFRGHGRSKPPGPRHGGWGFDAYVDQDLPAALARVAAEHDVPIGEVRYVGHSLGGLVGLAYAARAAITGAPVPGRMALLATSCWRFDPTTSAARRLTMTAYLTAARLRGHAPIRLLGLGSDDEPLSYVTELVGWARSGRWTSARDGFDFGAGLASVRQRVLLVHGGGDWMCTPEDTERLRRELEGAPTRVLCVSRRTGFAFDPDHFGLVRSRRARPVWDEIASFLF